MNLNQLFKSNFLIDVKANKGTHNSYEVYLIFPQHKEKNIKENLI